MPPSPILLSTAKRGIRASFWRGGTSKGLLIQGPHLPLWRDLSSPQKSDLRSCERLLQPFFRAAFGSPDPYARQLNGMGGGISSLSKAIIVEKSTSKDADIDYYFVQIGIKDGTLDMAGNCGNMTSAVAPFALDAGLLTNIETSESPFVSRGPEREVLNVRLRNMNTNKLIMAEIRTTSDGTQIYFDEKGSYVLDGVSGTASPITLSFLNPGGSKTGRALPTGHTVDTLSVTGQEIAATLIDVSNPGVFVDGRDLGWNPDLKPEQLTAESELMAKLESIRRGGAAKMGLNPDVPSIPKIVLVYPPHNDSIDVRCQALSMEQAHKAVPVTLALNLGVACKLAGTIPHKLARARSPQNTIIGHPSGKLEVGAEIVDGHIKSAKLIRTARWLMDGQVNDTPNNFYKL